MSVSFLERLIAYLIDSIIILCIVGIITSPIKHDDNYENKYKDLTTSLTSGEISNSDYLKEYKKLSYEVQKDNVAINIITLLLTSVYFIAFQYLNKGQTIGKKLVKIKVVDRINESIPTLKQIFIRSLFIYSLISQFISIIMIYILNKNSYFITSIIFSSLDELFIIVTMTFILYRKDKLGLHDIIAKTKVVKEIK